MKTTPNPYSGYRNPAELISHAVYLYFRFALSYRDVEEIHAARGIVVLRHYSSVSRIRSLDWNVNLEEVPRAGA